MTKDTRPMEWDPDKDPHDDHIELLHPFAGPVRMALYLAVLDGDLDPTNRREVKAAEKAEHLRINGN